jgi:predicted DNA-binding antitoxin AbrB/MazE fold protein
MSITIEATYEGGVLKPRQPLPFDEHETVHVTVHSNKRVRDEGKRLTPSHGPGQGAPPPTEQERVNLSSGASQDESADFAGSEMVDIWLSVPPSPTAKTVIARHAPLPLPDMCPISSEDDRNE